MGPGDHVRVRVGDRCRGVAGLGLDQDRVGQERGAGRSTWRTSTRTRHSSGAAGARGRARRRLRPRRRSCRRCRARPRSRRAGSKSSPSPIRTRATRSLTGCLAVRGAHQVVLLASLARASGLTFEGPQPKRPSAGFSAAGISTSRPCHRSMYRGGKAGLPVRCVRLGRRTAERCSRVAARRMGPVAGVRNPHDLDLERACTQSATRRTRPRRPEPPDHVLPLHRRDPVADRRRASTASSPRSSRVIAWFAIVFTGKYPEGLYNFNAGYLRMIEQGERVRVSAHRRVAAVRRRRGAAVPGPCRRPPAARQYSRLKTGLRLIIGIPVYILAIVQAIILSRLRADRLVRDSVHGQAPGGPVQPDALSLGLPDQGDRLLPLAHRGLAAVLYEEGWRRARRPDLATAGGD